MMAIPSPFSTFGTFFLAHIHPAARLADALEPAQNLRGVLAQFHDDIVTAEIAGLRIVAL